MAFHIDVYRASDLEFIHYPPVDVSSEEFDCWMDEA